MFGLRTGFFLGFIGGAIVSSLLGKGSEEEPAEPEAASAQAAGPAGVLGEIKWRLRTARQAAREAAEEKEREMRREFEEAIHRENQLTHR